MGETSTIVVAGADDGRTEALQRLVQAAGPWSTVPMRWPEAVATDVSAYVIEQPIAELVRHLAARPAHTPLIVIGAAPVAEAAPSAWLPAPSSAVLGAVLAQLLDGAPAPAGPTVRRKSDMIVGNSRQLEHLRAALDQLAPAQTPVLITGESGTGKELVARALHFSGPRAAQPFIAINCGAIPEALFEAELFGHQKGAFTGAVNARAGAFEAAHGGTLFLDEIGELPREMQTKLLRVLQTSEVTRVGSTEPKAVNFRLVTATNRDLEKEVAGGSFREDLFYRIHVYPVHVAPLRERPEDIPPIVTHHLAAIARREGLPTPRVAPAALEKLLGHRWPGNVRELVNALERALLLADRRGIEAEHVQVARTSSASGTTPIAYREAKARFDRDYYAQLMRTAGGNVTLAAKLGHKTRKEIYDALKKLDLKPREED